MRALLHRWLMRPNTSRPPRHLFAANGARIGHYPIRRHVAPVARYEHSRDDTSAVENDEAKGPPIRRVMSNTSQDVDDLLGTSVREYNMRASTASGVLSVDQGADIKGSFAELTHQADVDNDSKVGKLLVDRPEHRHNYKLWVELMLFKRRIAGNQGVVEVWNGMRRRRVDLPTEGEEAQLIWEECIRVTCADDLTQHQNSCKVRKEIINHAVGLKERTGKSYGPLYRSLVGKLLTTPDALAGDAHEQLSQHGLGFRPGEIKHLVTNVLENPFPYIALLAFKRIYISSNERDLYDSAMPLVLEVRGAEHALLWHRMFLAAGDVPSDAILAMPQIRQLFELDKDAALPARLRHRKYRQAAHHAIEERAKLREHIPLTREAMSGLVGDVHGIKPKEISDSFVAKMFATSAFSLNLVVRGLSFFSIQELGPLAVREVAVRAGSAISFRNVLADLKSLNVTLADTAYCRLVTKIAGDGQTELFKALLASDQHPESYDDTTTQEALLSEYLEQELWANVNVTMTSLSLSGVPLERRAINVLVQYYLRNRIWSLVSSTIQKMQSEQIAPTARTLIYLFRYMLPERHPGNAPKRQHPDGKPPFDSLEFVTTVCMYSQDARANVPRYYWVELLKRYGLTYRWEGLEKLCLWLSSHGSMQSQRLNVRFGGRRVVLKRPQLLINEVFTRQMQQAIFVWGFNSAALRHQLSMSPPRATGAQVATWTEKVVHHPWTQGLRLLQQMKHCQILINDHNLQRALVNRMWILFGPGNSSQRFNEFARRENILQLSDYIRQAREAYDIDLAPQVRPEDLTDTSRHQARLKLAFFGPHRQGSADTRARRQNWTDVTAGGDSGIIAIIAL
ncbi:hypothetical protein LTR78_003094 [Recurvomyces mirabilis]|uniref:Uncharacterized protein n=1 Tax=Recurvomyces mirabilis TaxID=574656 RepID=A0AAE0WRV1_9PEZI|nr:hypothetical protein LTR78_003094 [Recurvomyces mirabilis]KAK5157084.1 hypothetical protein LTS14_004602 [Recurvomyces mirabilis]